MLQAIAYKDVDHIPCCFISFTALRKRLKEDMFALCKAELEMGLDSMLFIPAAGRPQRPDHPDLRGLPVRFHPQVEVTEKQEKLTNGNTVIHKQYRTPAGKLTTSVDVTEDWTHGSHVPFIDDYQVPRAHKPLITEPSELEILKYMLTPPTEEDIAKFKQEAERARAFSQQYGVMVAGGWGVGMDMVNWLCGMQQLMFLSMDNPSMVEDLLDMIHKWNMERMRVVLSAPVDLYIRRAWYEGVDFVVPGLYKKVILPRLKAEVDLAHEYGTKFGYICSSGTKPLLDTYPESGIDVLIGVDPVQGTHTDMALMKEKLNEKVALWGGVSGAITVELGQEDEIRAAVAEAVAKLGPTGFILSPVDNITIDESSTWDNIQIFMDQWRKSW
jgi:uroporphyrinogen-III decarboxylase